MEILGKAYPYYTTSAANAAQRPVEIYSIEEQKNRFISTSSIDMKKHARTVLKDVPSWLPLAAEKYNISANLKDYILAPVVSLPSDLPNLNQQAFPYSELTSWVVSAKMPMYKTWAGSPVHNNHCFPAYTPVRTKKGYKAINTIKVGDEVLTHMGRYRKVKKLYKNGVKSLSKITVMGLIDNIEVTPNHPILMVDPRVMSKYNPYKNSYGKSVINRFLSWEECNAHFRLVSDLHVGDYVVVPIKFGGNIKVDPAFAFLVGAFMAEGSFQKYGKNKTYGGVVFTIGRSEAIFRDKLIECAEKIGLTPKVHYHSKFKNTVQISIWDAEFAQTLLYLTGEYAHKKRIKGELRKWDKESIKHFLGGYITGDGHIKQPSPASNRGSFSLRCRTASKKLAKDLQQAFGFVGMAAYCNYDQKPYKSEYMCPYYDVKRTINGKGSYVVTVNWNYLPIIADYHLKTSAPNKEVSIKGSQCRAYLKGDKLLLPITSIEHNVKEDEVFNIEVEEDNSYIAGDVAVHNCNDDYTIAKGIIFSSIMVPIENSAGSLFKIIQLVGIDRTRDPIIANDILSRKRTHYSIGAYTQDYSCSICGQLFSKAENKGLWCEHVDNVPKFKVFNGKLAYWNVLEPIGFEISSLDGTGAFVSTWDTPILQDSVL